MDAWLQKSWSSSPWLSAAAEVAALLMECTLPSSCPERPAPHPDPCHRDRPPVHSSQTLMDGPHAGLHTSPSSLEAVTLVIGVTSVDCMPRADKTVPNRELRGAGLDCVNEETTGD